MLRTKSMVSSITEVPREWVFEHYLELGQMLTGQDIRMKSIFNPNDIKPSFFVFYSRNKRKYLFKDFSTDQSGDGTQLVKELFSLTTRGEAAHKIIDDYNKFVLTDKDAYNERVFKLQEKFKVTDFTVRKWTKVDQNFWTKFKIGSSLLEEHNIKPLKEYTLTKEDTDREIVISTPMLYGYFKNDGTLYKIYQPKSKNAKFVKVKEYIQGSEQLTYQKPYLIICSSMKDMLALKKLKFNNIETVAPDSENIPISKAVIASYKLKYKNVCTIFDNDAAGQRAMLRYQELYNIPFAHIKLEKDLADCLKEHGIKSTRVNVFPVLSKALTGKTKQL